MEHFCRLGIEYENKIIEARGNTNVSRADLHYYITAVRWLVRFFDSALPFIRSRIKFNLLHYQDTHSVTAVVWMLVRWFYKIAKDIKINERGRVQLKCNYLYYIIMYVNIGPILYFTNIYIILYTHIL